MRMVENILLILGAAFAGVGLLIAIIFIGAFGGVDVFTMIPFFFVILGGCFIGYVVVSRLNKRKIIVKGTKYAAKIYGYVKNTSVEVNGEFTSDTKVHYFDKNGVEREAILPTGFASGAGTFPIGMTIDIYELNGKYNFDPKSVRNEVLLREDELMDNKPLNPELINVIAVKCPNCGASFEATSGYSSRCPYCGGFINA